MKYIIVIGCGKTGRELAFYFAQKHNVVVIDKQQEALDYLGEEFNGRVILGDALDVTILEEAGIKEADSIALTTGNGNLNIVVAKIAKKKYHVDKVVVQVYDPYKEKIFAQDGITIINKTNILADVFKQDILE